MFEETAEYKKYKARLDEKAKTVIQGDDVIHLTYLQPLVNKKDLEELQKELTQVNIRLSSWDDFDVIKASLEDFSLQVFLLLRNPLSVEILKTIGLNSVWEAVKFATLKLHSRIFRNSSGSAKEIAQQINFGFMLKVNDKVTFEFKLDGDLSDELISNSMDKALEFIREYEGKSIPVFELPVYSKFNKKKSKWEKVNVREQIKKHKNRK